MGKYVWKDGIPAISTFSIVARDGKTDELGIAVQSKFLAVGAAVPWAAADAGAIATQSWANTSYGPQGLAALRSGQSAQDVLDMLVSNDSDRSFRQVGIVDRNGGSATYTGDQCFSWAGGRHGENFACQGNILAGEEVVNALADTYVQEVDLPFAERLLAALAARKQPAATGVVCNPPLFWSSSQTAAMADLMTAILTCVWTITRLQLQS